MRRGFRGLRPRADGNGRAPRRTRRFGLSLALFSICVGCGLPAHPNVVLIVVDTLRADHLGAYGYDRPTSPVLDALAEEGVRFERAYTTAPWTKPAVASVLTGLYPGEHRVTGVENVLPESLDTLAEILKRNGYATAAVVSAPWLSKRNGFSQGFDVYDERHARGADYISSQGVTDVAIRLLRRLRDQRPFFLFVHYFDPHNTYRRHPGVGFAPPAMGRLDDRPHIRQLRAMLDDLTEEEIAFVIDLYDEEIRYTDAHIGRLLAALREFELESETVVAMTADHGEEFLERGWIGHVRSLHEELLRVPLIVRDPTERNPGAVVEQPVSVASLTPTILELSGFDPTPFGFHSPSLAGAIRGESKLSPGVVYAEVDYRPTWRELPIKRTQMKAVVVGHFKLVRDELRGEFELYDLAADPKELVNLATARPELVSRLSRVLAERATALRAGARPEGTRPLSAQEIEQLRELGYLEGTD